ncbi:pentatricopeptide repeat-containing protein At5g66520-like [Typha latifolia]|uniref:pentatricopeptide repeat-containing protein At5g66520-like n=1 Tax=Typha latifolia TaxID=4733 RepID=UPI003C2E0FBC
MTTAVHRIHFKAISQLNIHPLLIQTSNIHHPPTQSIAAAPLNLNHPILSKLESCPNLSQFNQIHAQITTSGLFNNVFAASRLLKCCTDTLNPPNLPLGQLIFSQIQNPDVFSYNLVIKAFSLSCHPLKSLSLYQELLNRGLSPNEYTFCFLLDCCSRGIALWEGRQVHAHLKKHGLDTKLHSGTSLLHMHGDCGALTDALRSFEEIPVRSDVSWGAVIDACVNHGEVGNGLRLFKEMRSLDLEPNNATLVSVLSACAELGDVTVGRAVHAYVAVRGSVLNITLGTSLVDMYAKSGAIDMAMAVFSAMHVRTVASWNCLIHGMAINGQGDKAITLLEMMQHDDDINPNGTTFLSVLHACSHSGLVEDGIKLFAEMSKFYKIVPTIEHYGCMVDLYGRAGRISEAMDLISSMPMRPDIGIWGALAVACKAHGCRDLGELMAAKIIKMAPYDICGYLFLSDTYANESRWVDVIGLRKMMREMDIRKAAGYSSVANSFQQESTLLL